MNIFILSEEGYRVAAEWENIQNMFFPGYKGLVVFLCDEKYKDKEAFLKEYDPRKDCIILAKPAESGGDEVSLSAIFSPEAVRMKGADKADYNRMEDFCKKMCRYLRNDDSDCSTYAAIQQFKLQYVEQLKSSRSE